MNIIGKYHMSVLATAIRKAGLLEKTFKKLSYGISDFNKDKAVIGIQNQLEKDKKIIESHKLHISDQLIKIISPEGEEEMKCKIEMMDNENFIVHILESEIGKDRWRCYLRNNMMFFESLDVCNELAEFGFERDE